MRFPSAPTPPRVRGADVALSGCHAGVVDKVQERPPARSAGGRIASTAVPNRTLIPNRTVTVRTKA